RGPSCRVMWQSKKDAKAQIKILSRRGLGPWRDVSFPFPRPDQSLYTQQRKGPSRARTPRSQRIFFAALAFFARTPIRLPLQRVRSGQSVSHFLAKSQSRKVAKTQRRKAKSCREGALALGVMFPSHFRRGHLLYVVLR